MSKVAIKGNASGTGTFTLEAPNSNTDRTLTLPDEAGTVLTSASDITNQANSNIPLFSATISGDQSLTAGSTVKVQWDVEEFDTDNTFDHTTNYRYTPTTAGYYLLSTTLVYDTDGSNTRCVMSIYKNGEAWHGFHGVVPSTTDVYQSGSGSVLAYANGSTDYFEIYIYVEGSNPVLKDDTTGNNEQYGRCRFSGYLVRAV